MKKAAWYAPAVLKARRDSASTSLRRNLRAYQTKGTSRSAPSVSRRLNMLAVRHCVQRDGCRAACIRLWTTFHYRWDMFPRAAPAPHTHDPTPPPAVAGSFHCCALCDLLHFGAYKGRNFDALRGGGCLSAHVRVCGDVWRRLLMRRSR